VGGGAGVYETPAPAYPRANETPARDSAKGGCVDVDTVDGSESRVPLRGLDHGQDARPDGRRQVGPCLDYSRKVRIGGLSDACQIAAKWAGFRAALL